MGWDFQRALGNFSQNCVLNSLRLLGKCQTGSLSMTYRHEHLVHDTECFWAILEFYKNSSVLPLKL